MMVMLGCFKKKKKKFDLLREVFQQINKKSCKAHVKSTIAVAIDNIKYQLSDYIGSIIKINKPVMANGS